MGGVDRDADLALEQLPCLGPKALRIARSVGHGHYLARRLIGPNEIGNFDAVEQDGRGVIVSRRLRDAQP